MGDPNAEYRARELRRVLERGPFPGEDFFRLKVTGNRESRWINVTAEQLDAIADIVGGQLRARGGRESRTVRD